MALIKCTECGKEFSDKAGACPNCGCPVDAMKESPKEKTAFQKLLYGDENAVKKANSNGLKCPKCKSHNIDLWSNQANMKEFQRTGLNLNPLHPLTPFKTKTVKKEKVSAAKVGLGLMTGGASLLVTGTKKKAHNEYYCRDCGHRWIGK